MNVRARLSFFKHSFLLNPNYLVGDYIDAGQAFYSTDFWSIWDIGIVLTGIAFFVTSKSTGFPILQPLSLRLL
jgi:hypothetical protein